jgi:ADP-ribose pyrophosphatase
MVADPLAWETLSSETAYTCPGFDVVQEDVRLPDGTETDFDYLSEPPAVVILPFTRDGDVVIIEEWRQAVDRVNRGLPAGTTEPDDDDFAAAARRELAEETGYGADRIEHLETVEPANGVANAVHHHYIAHGCTPTGEQELDHDETIRVSTVPFDEVYADVLAGDVRDGRMALAVLTYAATERNA